MKRLGPALVCAILILAVCYPSLAIVPEIETEYQDYRWALTIEVKHFFNSRLIYWDGKKWHEPKIDLEDIRTPKISPDGTKIVFDGRTDESWKKRDIYVYDIASATTKRITEASEVEKYTNPVWSSNGKQILAVRSLQDRSVYEIVLIDRKTSSKKSLYKSTLSIRNLSWGEQYYCFTDTDLTKGPDHDTTLIMWGEIGSSQFKKELVPGQVHGVCMQPGSILFSGKEGVVKRLDIKTKTIASLTSPHRQYTFGDKYPIAVEDKIFFISDRVKGSNGWEVYTRKGKNAIRIIRSEKPIIGFDVKPLNP